MSKYLSEAMADMVKDNDYMLRMALTALYDHITDAPTAAAKLTVEDALLTWGCWPDTLELMNQLAHPFNLEFYLMEESGDYYLVLDTPGQTAPAEAVV